MIQQKQSKKIKGARKKIRDELIERLQCKYPTWFEGRSIEDVRSLVTGFKNSNYIEDEFPKYCIEYDIMNKKEK